MSRFINPVPQFWLDNGEVASSGLIEFYENKNFSSKKDTYNDIDQTVKNTNPVKLDGQGRMPPCFGEGLYSVKFYAYDNSALDKKGPLQWSRDDVDLSSGSGGAFDEWSSVQTYAIGTVVKDNGVYYELYGSNTSKGERPSTTPSKWEKILFITEYNPSRPSYSLGDTVIKDGFLYSSKINNNASIPPTANWNSLSFNNEAATFTPSIRGTTTAGTGTYSVQHGYFSVIGDLVFGYIDLNWSAHTGTGDIEIAGLPFVASSASGTISGGATITNASLLSYTAGRQLTGIVISGTQRIRLLGVYPGGGADLIPIDTSAGISMNFMYRRA